MSAALHAHLRSGVTTICRCWAITRRDGVTLGFTDHDRPLAFDGVAFRPESGLTAMAVEQMTGLSVDNTEAIGVLSDLAVREQDLDEGRFDGAGVRAWLVDWADPSARELTFRGHIGALTRTGTHFTAELRGLAEALNRPMGRVYQKPCDAVLGDRRCGVDLDAVGFSAIRPVRAVTGNRILSVADMDDFAPHWFRFGRVAVLDGAAGGMTGLIRDDRDGDGLRVLELWQPPAAQIRPGDRLRIEAGCDKLWRTCRDKFGNLVNFQGFPDLPGDGLMVSPLGSPARLDGGSRRS